MRAFNFGSSLLILDETRITNEETEFNARNPKSEIRNNFWNYVARSFAAVSVFLRSIVIVSGPTPPGTGVYKDVFAYALG